MCIKVEIRLNVWKLQRDMKNMYSAYILCVYTLYLNIVCV